MANKTSICVCLVCAGLAAAPAAAQVLVAGRPVDEGSDSEFRVKAGNIMNIEGMVEETTRTLYDVTGHTWKQGDAENYDLNDFGLESGYVAVGVGYEARWRFFTFDFDAAVMNPQADTVARRNYYIGVGDEIEYGGRSYENLKIPEGTPFSFELVGGVAEFNGGITPLTVRGGDVLAVTPSADFGIFTFSGYYKVDAGETVGTTQYMNPPEDFAVGGSSEGVVGLAVPQYGGGASIRIGRSNGARCVLDAHYLMCSFSGSTRYLTSSNHREKNIDLDHANIRTRLSMQFPRKKGGAFLVGAEYQSVDADASITHTAETAEEVLAMQERFDKQASFSMDVVAGFIGLTY